MLHAVIMAGGSGTRFWPKSRQRLPKQFLRLFGERSLIEQTADRIAGLVGLENIWVITNHLQAEQTRQQLPELAPDRIIGEPCGRDTAACIGLAAELLAASDPDARMVVLAADHLIRPVTAFHAAIRAADRFVSERPEALVTFGIPPDRAATEYGYLKRGAAAAEIDGTHVFRLESFHEKPVRAKAEEFLASGAYFWNSGIFAWRAATILAELERHRPAIRQATRRIAAAWPGPERDRVFAAEYAALDKISIDYAVMEHSSAVYMVQAPFQWDDVGSWLALERVLPADAASNVVIGEHHALRSTRTIVVGDNKHLIATIGVEDLIIVHTDDVTLVAHRRDEQAVKELLSELEQRGRPEVL